MPVMTQAEKDLIGTNKAQLTKLNPNPSEIFAIGQNPMLQLEIETGGATAQFQALDKESNHAVMSIEYARASEEVYLALMNKVSGAWRTLLALRPDGTATIGNGITQAQLATLGDMAREPKAFDVLNRQGIDLNTLKTKGRFLVDGVHLPPHTTTGILTVSELEGTADIIQVVENTTSYVVYERMYDGASWSAWKESEVTHALGLLTHMIIGKASKTSLPTIYSGDTVPLNSLGKDLDWYHHFEAGSTLAKVLFDSTCRDSYNSNLFALASLYGGDASQNDIIVIEVSPKTNMIYIDLKNGTTLPVEDLTLEITNHGDAPVDIPLIIYSNAAGEFMGTYLTSYDPVIAKIVGYDGANSSSFRLKVKEGVLTAKEYDYQKHNGVWYRTDFLNVDQVNALIREYSVTVSMDTNINKPTEAECISAFEQLPHFDYTKDDGFYIMSTNKGKLNFVKYFAHGATDAVNHTVGLFFVKELTPAT